jgi:hypothetical protein
VRCEVGVVGMRMMCADERLRFDPEDVSHWMIDVCSNLSFGMVGG